MNLARLFCIAGHRRFAGTLAIAAADHIVLAADDAGDIEIPLVAIERARTQFDWEPTPKPGKVPKAPASRGAGRAKRPVGGAAEGVEQNDEAGRIEPASDDRRVRGQADAVHSEIDQHETANGVRR